MTFIQILLDIAGIVLIIIALAFIYFIIINHRNWNRYAASGRTETATVTWDLFKRIYELNPSAYEVDERCIYREYNTDDKWPYYKKVYIRFKTIFDFVAAQKYFKGIKKQKKKEAKNAQEIAGMEKLRDLAQQDIDAIRASVDKDLKQLRKNIS